MRKMVRHFIRSGRAGGTNGKPHVEVPPHDELPKPTSIALVPSNRHTENAKTATRLQLLGHLGLPEGSEAGAFGPFAEGAREFAAHHCAEIAALAGGVCPSGASSMVSSAALQLAGSRFAYAKFAETGQASWLKLASSLSDASRQNLLAAHSVAVLSGQAKQHHDRGDEHLYLPPTTSKKGGK